MSRRRRSARTPPLGSPPPSKRQRWNEEAARHAAIFVGDAGAQLDEVEEVDAGAMQLDAGAMQLDEVEEVDANNGLRWRAPQRWANSHGLPPPPLPSAERARRSPPSNYVCVKARFGSIIHDNKAGEVARLQVFLRHMHLITQRASWIMKLWYANMPHPEILTDKDVKHLLDALNYGDITRGGIFQGTLHDYDTNVENLTAVSQATLPRGNLQNTIAYTATSLVTNLEVNVSVNFMKKLRQYVERRFCIKAILREFNHVTNKHIRKFLCKRLWRRFNRLWRLITNLDVLSEDELPAFEPAFETTFFDIWGKIWSILPNDPKRFEFNLAYAVACEPAKYVGAYCALSRLWQAAQFPALFSAIPVRTSHVQSYVPIDTKTLLDVITCPPGRSKLPHSSLEQKLAHWNVLCDVSHKSFQDCGNYNVSVRHVNMNKVTITANGRPMMPKPRKVSKAAQRAAVNRLYIDTPENAAVICDRILHPDPNAPVVLCDPNVCDMLYLKEYGTDNIMRYTLSQQKKETKARERVKKCNKDRLRNLAAPGGGSLEATMPGHKSMLMLGCTADDAVMRDARCRCWSFEQHELGPDREYAQGPSGPQNLQTYSVAVSFSSTVSSRTDAASTATDPAASPLVPSSFTINLDWALSINLLDGGYDDGDCLVVGIFKAVYSTAPPKSAVPCALSVITLRKGYCCDRNQAANPPICARVGNSANCQLSAANGVYNQASCGCTSTNSTSTTSTSTATTTTTSNMFTTTITNMQMTPPATIPVVVTFPVIVPPGFSLVTPGPIPPPASKTTDIQTVITSVTPALTTVLHITFTPPLTVPIVAPTPRATPVPTPSPAATVLPAANVPPGGTVPPGASVPPGVTTGARPQVPVPPASTGPAASTNSIATGSAVPVPPASTGPAATGPAATGTTVPPATGGQSTGPAAPKITGPAATGVL
ncbi:hypothetical protein HDU90_004217, partial [Geranomyces variabilis]